MGIMWDDRCLSPAMCHECDQNKDGDADGDGDEGEGESVRLTGLSDTHLCLS